MGLKAALLMLHLVFAGVLFLFDMDLIEKTKHEPWYVYITVKLESEEIYIYCLD